MGRGSLGLAASASWRPIEGFFQGPSSRGWSAAAGGGECGRGGSAMPFGRRRRIGVIGTGKNSRMGRWPAVKEFHPDVCKDIRYSDTMIRRVIQAYEMLSKYHKFEDIEGESSDPFENPECEAVDVFVNEILCVGKACPYSCVKTAPHAFSFSPLSGAARAISQDRSENYQVQLAVGQCPRRCIHYVTPSQRSILEELLCGYNF
ncbi:unnamed protein product [Spirodela intermedia]|uniref:Uncharacterized protein n=1 Tax=Spirodela intermedia TaxID=51605 RepID=A0A7I8L891_SPIIN|nr:unnamed protein product [Spirodela intermedia]